MANILITGAGKGIGLATALDDDAWYARVEQDFGMDARPKP